MVDGELLQALVLVLELFEALTSSPFMPAYRARTGSKSILRFQEVRRSEDSTRSPPSDPAELDARNRPECIRTWACRRLVVAVLPQDSLAISKKLAGKLI